MIGDINIETKLRLARGYKKFEVLIVLVVLATELHHVLPSIFGNLLLEKGLQTHADLRIDLLDDYDSSIFNGHLNYLLKLGVVLLDYLEILRVFILVLQPSDCLHLGI